MPDAPSMILSSGGIRSLIAATMASSRQGSKVILLHLLDDRPNAKIRSQFIQRQAKHLAIQEVIETKPRRPKTKHRDTDHQPATAGPLARSRVLIDGLAQAVASGAGTLIWPVQANGDFDLAARLIEQTVLAHDMAQLEHPAPPKIDTPLLELGDQQLIELGKQLNLPWELAWSCLRQLERPCRMCDGCHRRSGMVHCESGKSDRHPPPDDIRAGTTRIVSDPLAS